jgi:tRNA (cytidine/uridine-2'-O-)-methyltransferase
MGIVLPETAPLAIVLIEPQIPQNTGNIARLCCCTGVELFLVGSLGFHRGDKFLKRAGMDYLDQAVIQYAPDFETVLAQKPGWSCVYLTSKATQSIWEAKLTPNTLLVLGSETTGLPESFIAANQQHCYRIPMVETVRSLNLASSTAIVLYEALRQLKGGN